MKVLFLDIDGVLNRIGTKTKFGGFRGLEPALVQRFLHWKYNAQPDLEIVLSSSWRIPTAFADFREHLRQNKIGWIDETPVLGERGLEIRTWLQAHPEVTHWVVLDDCQMKGVGNHLVQTSEVTGVTDKNLAQINKLLRDE